MTTLEAVEGAALAFTRARDELGAELADLQHVIDTERRRRMPRLRDLVREAVARKAELVAAVEAAAVHFERPKTRVFHAVKVGFRKGKGEIRVADPERTVALIEKHLPHLAETLVKVVRTPIKAAMGDLDVRDLRKIGVEVHEAGDEVVVKPVDAEVDRLVAALIDSAELEGAER